MRQAHLHVAHCAVIAALWPEIDLVAVTVKGKISAIHQHLNKEVPFDQLCSQMASKRVTCFGTR